MMVAAAANALPAVCGTTSPKPTVVIEIRTSQTASPRSRTSSPSSSGAWSSAAWTAYAKMKVRVTRKRRTIATG